MRRRTWFAAVAAGLAAAADPADTPEWKLHRPKLAGTFRLRLRDRQVGKGGQAKVVTREADWQVAETAVIVCDMWDDIYCKAAAQRIGVMVPRMNAVLSAARDHGALIIHAPSDTMTMYADTPQRLRMRRPSRSSPVPIVSYCDRDPDREPPLPLETKKSPCDDPVTGAIVRRYSREHPGLDILGYDGVSDGGREIFSYCRRRGVKNIALMGVHTNMCILCRSFGVRSLVRLGFNVALVRDLTDAMYDPRQPPFVSHARATELTVEHIEAYWCPSVPGEDLTRVLPGSAGPGKGAAVS
ncbi:MAG: isochorismatase family protein [Isosphaeraceae bacterium]